MANETFSLEAENFDNAVKIFLQKCGSAEDIINDFLHNEAPDIMKPSIVGLVPVSNRNKTHAKTSNPFGRQEDKNLSVKIITSKNFNYLVFPDEGLGTSVRNLPQDFTGRGLEAVTAELLDDMTAKILQKIQE